MRRKHLAALERRYKWLVSLSESGRANSFDLAEVAALEAALPLLRDKKGEA